MLACLAIASALITFPGGSIADLVDNVGGATGKNIFVSQAFAQEIKKFEYATAPYSDLTRDIRRGADLRVVPGTDLVFHDETLLPGWMSPTKVGEKAPMPKWKVLKEENIVQGKITFHTHQAERLDPISLASVRFSKPLTVHWLLKGYGVAVYAEKMGERDFLRCLAKSIGGKFVEDKKGYHLNLDPEAFRLRVLKLLQLRAGVDVLDGEDGANLRYVLGLYAIVFRNVEPAVIEAAFETEGAKATSEALPLSPFASSITSALQTGSRSPGFDRKNLGFRTPSGMAYMDPNGGFGVTLTADFRVDLSFWTSEERGSGKLRMSLALDARI